ncbi:hypothetical protein [Campylobacter jejuni]|uniref:hypothetical protein n=1 Tax=Campylobacter jejuni TaxID=197 RepID=UPI00274078D4|nr:hypothetical protein [Campylobacter jejuni]
MEKDILKEEIISIKNYIDKNGSFRTYEDGNQYAEIHLENTGKDRSGHALYMCAWRIENGEYDSYF